MFIFNNGVLFHISQKPCRFFFLSLTFPFHLYFEISNIFYFFILLRHYIVS